MTEPRKQPPGRTPILFVARGLGVALTIALLGGGLAMRGKDRQIDVLTDEKKGYIESAAKRDTADLEASESQIEDAGGTAASIKTILSDLEASEALVEEQETGLAELRRELEAAEADNLKHHAQIFGLRTQLQNEENHRDLYNQTWADGTQCIVFGGKRVDGWRSIWSTESGRLAALRMAEAGRLDR